MIAEKIDSIVCSALTDQDLPVHFYLKCLNFCVDCLREINMDIMRNVITKELQLDGIRAAKVPCDFLDWVEIGAPVGQYIKSMPQKQEINPLINRDSTGAPIPYGDPTIQLPADFIADGFPYYNRGYLNFTNNHGENMGGFFGWGGGSYRFSFKYVKERGEIQMDINFPCDHIILKYISDGLDSCGCDTLVNPYAFQTIKTYAIWQYYLNNKLLMKAAPLWESRFITELRKLRGRMNSMTVDDILMVLRKNYKATIKN